MKPLPVYSQRPFVSLAWYAFPLLLSAAMTFSTSSALAQTGVDDDRVSLPEGPGSLEGVGENVEIDPNMGSMQYAIPIVVPRGLNGLTPSVGLNYSSAGGSSSVGVGWSMPMQSIERMTSRGTPRYDSEDYFAVNGGNELVLIGGTDNAQVYRERFEGSFIRYTWQQVDEGEAGYWIAEYPDGSIGYFGANQSGQLIESARSTRPSGGVYKYHLVEKVEPFGHIIRYDYTELESNWPLLSKISYVYENGVPVYTVNFDYEERKNDPASTTEPIREAISDAGAGYEELLQYRLKGVNVKVRGEIVREYALTYEDYDTSGGFTRLTKVSRYGKGGMDSGRKYPIEFSFEYSRALGVGCESGMNCDRPYLKNMQTVDGATGLTQGTATLLDINADGLPDVVDTTGEFDHRIFFNTITPEGDTLKHVFSDARESAMGTGSAFGLDGENTQVIDVNGDGLSDLINVKSGTTLLSGYGLEDWAGLGEEIEVLNTLDSVDVTAARFIDYNNDKKIDLMTSDGASTTIYENLGSSFKVVSEAGIDVTFSSNPTVQLSDMNGDGMNDVIEIGDTVRYRINYGWGKWSGWRTIDGLFVETSERELVDLEDLNGDGLSDIVIVNGSVVKYAINRNGSVFDAMEQITSENIEGNLPERKIGDKVLYADMNANGSEDVVWFDSNGQVQYLEIFPTRPNLLTKIDNGIGMVQEITYTTSAEEEARARAEDEAWEKTLSIPMNIVKTTETYVTLAPERREKVTYYYRDGFYDGKEKQFRGFEKVRMEVEASESQEGGATVYEFNVGQEKPHMNGKMLSQIITSGDRILSEQQMFYEECDVRDVPSISALESQGRFPIYFPCEVKTTTIIKEGEVNEDAWVTTELLMDYDDQGNVIKNSNLGVVGVDGDELYNETLYYKPGEGERWFLNLPLSSSTYTVNGSATKTEEKYYYDGEPFIGAQVGLTHGFLMRQTTKANDEGLVLDTLRQDRDDHGNVVASIDPNGSLSDTDRHRREYVYDDLGLFMTYLDIHIDAGHVLRRSTQYEEEFQKMVSVTDWVLVQDDREVSSRNEQRYSYDDFGRITAMVRPGDEDATPTVQYEYDLGDPYTTVTVKGRSERNGAVDSISHQCFDGRGRMYQKRMRLADGTYQVSGLDILNSRGASIETFQPYTDSSGECDTYESISSMNVLSSTAVYDAQYRTISESAPGEDIYGERLETKTVYKPLEVWSYDPEDLDEDSPHFDTPTIRHQDGLGRLKGIERRLAGGESASYDLFYDATNSFAGYADPAGNKHELNVDYANRILSVTDPTTGTTTFSYDDAGNVISQKDARGVETIFEYDGGNRLIGKWDAANKSGTKISFFYDDLPQGCDRTECTHTANRLAMITYPSIFGETSERFGYDARQRTIFQARRFGTELDLWTRTEFDNQDRAILQTYADGGRMEMGYDNAGRLTSVPGILDAIIYTERGRVGEIKYNNGASQQKRYDALERLESLMNLDASGQIIDGMLYAHDRKGNLTGVQDMSDFMGPTHEASFDYDAWYRVTSSTQKRQDDGDETVRYEFDALDRITGITSDLEGQSSAHVGEMSYESTRPHALSSAGDLSFEFDATGQMTRRGELTLEWDFLNRITRFAKDDEGEDHVYGAEKSRVAILGEDRVVFYGFGGMEVRDGVSSFYVRHDGDRLARVRNLSMATKVYDDLDGDGEITSADAWLITEAGVSQDAAITPKRALGAAAEGLLQRSADEKIFLHTDHLKSVIATTDEGGEVIGRRAYNMTGVLRHEVGELDHFGFTGQEHNLFSGLIQYEMRDLDPVTGRWASFDPQFVRLNATAMSALGEATSPYAYVAGNFANNIDPRGLNKKTPGQVGARGGGNNQAKNKAMAGLKGAQTSSEMNGKSLKPSNARKMEKEGKEMSAVMGSIGIGDLNAQVNTNLALARVKTDFQNSQDSKGQVNTGNLMQGAAKTSNPEAPAHATVSAQARLVEVSSQGPSKDQVRSGLADAAKLGKANRDKVKKAAVEWGIFFTGVATAISVSGALTDWTYGFD